MREIPVTNQTEADSTRFKPDIQFINTHNPQAHKVTDNKNLLPENKRRVRNNISIDIWRKKEPRQQRIHRSSTSKSQGNTPKIIKSNIWNTRRGVNTVIHHKQAGETYRGTDVRNSPRDVSNSVRMVPDIIVIGQDQQ